MPMPSTIATRTRCRAMPDALCGLCLVLMAATAIRGDERAVANSARGEISTARDVTPQTDALSDSEDFFERRVRPLLAKH